MRFRTRAQLAHVFTDGPLVPRGSGPSDMWKVVSEINRSQLAQKVPYEGKDDTNNSMDQYVQSLIAGDVRLNANSPEFLEISAEINSTKINSIIDSNTMLSPSELALVPRSHTAMLDQFQLAALLAKTGIAQGMAIGLSNHDFHGPVSAADNSSVLTPRAATQMWSFVRCFTEWAIKNNLMDKVILVVSHEFSRTAYNTHTAASAPIFELVGGSEVSHTVPIYGTDHQPVAGFNVISGLVPSCRVGGVVDGYSPRPTTDLQGSLDLTSNAAAYRSIDIMGTIYMRVFPQLFPDARAVQRIWPNFVALIDYLLVG